MSLREFLKLDDDDKDIKCNPTGELVYIQLIGGHGSGKSTIVGELKKKYGNFIDILGKYVESKTNVGYLTGGTDMFKMTSQQRFDHIKEHFITNKLVVLAEGMFITWYNTFLGRYHELQTLKNRKIYIILLECEYDVLCDRIYKRSKGKEITKERLNNITSKAKTAKSAFDKLVETDNFIKKKFNSTNYDDMNIVVGFISDIIDNVLGISK